MVDKDRIITLNMKVNKRDKKKMYFFMDKEG